MVLFSYKGKTRGGETRKGMIEAPNKEEAQKRLRKLHLVPQKIRAEGKGFNRSIEIPGLSQNITEKEKVIFTRQFSTLIEAGIPLVQSLELLGLQAKNPAFHKVIYEVKKTVEEGSTFTDAIKKHPKVFDELYVNLVAAGEVGGILDIIFRRLATYIERAMKLKKKVKGALIYPSVIATVAVGVVTILMVWVIPLFAKMFLDMGRELPAPTLFVMDLSHWVSSNFIFMVGAFLASLFGAKLFHTWPTGRKIVDRWLLRIPVIGDLLRKASVARFTRTLSTLISSGVPLLQALDICSKISVNRTIESALQRTREQVEQGRTIGEPLLETGVFPYMVVQMIAVGEAAGSLDHMLTKIADFYDDEVDEAVNALMALMEPALMVFLGIVVGGLVIALYLPLLRLGDF